MNDEIPKVYDPQKTEQRWYKFWEKNGFFSPDCKTARLPAKQAGSPGRQTPFTIVIPPPNVTGSLHMGHALDNSIQDLLIRYHRMKGDPTLWLPGTDHAGIATQNVVEKALKKEKKTKDDLGREAFVKKVWGWKEEYGGKITSQLRRLGASCDWSRERFTMDAGLSKAVRREFVQLYKEGLIYRGKRIINWCPRCLTALSDIEVEHTTQKGKLWYIKYFSEKSEIRNPKSEQGKDYLIVATTRPETMLGDTAVAVNPKDKRYKHLIGKMLILPLVGRKIPVIKDDFVDPEFGTGAVKVTPAHDPNDFDLGQRHNLPQVNMLYPNGKVATKYFEEKTVHKYDGEDRYKAREEIVKDLEKQGCLEKIEDYQNAVGQCYRCKTIVEPYLSDQWFVKVEPLAKEAIRIVEEGKIKFVPQRWTKVYINWMVNLKDWCVSRQLWWGHRIPAWHCKSEIRNPKSEQCKEIIISETKPKKCPKCGGTKLEQDPDVFDTWFSSALWPFSTLGWPEETEDLKKYYPTSVLVTGYDIITFWVSRMIMMGMHFMKKEPFKTVFIHGLVRDVTGKKMSKSLGNVIDPVDVINHAGADALRFALISLITGQGQDIKLTENKIIECRNFANKIWNVSRFVLMNSSKGQGLRVKLKELNLVEKWILSKYNSVIKRVTDLVDSFEVGEGARVLYDFIWGEFCDWYVEFSKLDNGRKTTQQVLITVLEGTLRLLHPYMPFITEEIHSKLPDCQTARPSDSIMLAEWPKADESLIDQEAEERVDLIKEIIRAVRNIRAEMGVPVKTEAEVVLVASKNDAEVLRRTEEYIKKLSRAKLKIVEKLAEKPKQAAAAVVKTVQIYVPLAGLIDFEKEKERLEKAKKKLEIELGRIEKRLFNLDYLKKADPEKVAADKEKSTLLKKEIKLIVERINSLLET